MKDLIERLRDTASKGVSVWGDLQMEAADALEAAQAEIERHKMHIKHIGNDALRTENAALRAELAAMREAYIAGQRDMRDRAAIVCAAMPAPISCTRIEANLCDVMTMQCHECIRALSLEDAK